MPLDSIVILFLSFTTTTTTTTTPETTMKTKQRSKFANCVIFVWFWLIYKIYNGEIREKFKWRMIAKQHDCFVHNVIGLMYNNSYFKNRATRNKFNSNVKFYYLTFQNCYFETEIHSDKTTSHIWLYGKLLLSSRQKPILTYS